MASFDVELEILFNLRRLASCSVGLFGETAIVDVRREPSTLIPSVEAVVGVDSIYFTVAIISIQLFWKQYILKSKV